MDGQDQPVNDEAQTGEDVSIAMSITVEPNGSLESIFGVSEETLFDALEATLRRVGVGESVEVSLLITDDEGIQALNRDYRGKDEATDVLSFPLLDAPLVDAPADQLWQPAEEDSADPETLQRSRARDLDNGAEEGAENGSEPLSVVPSDEEIFAEGLDDDLNEESGEEMAFLDEFDEDAAFADLDNVERIHLGDIAIARETTLRQAERAAHSAAYEVTFLFTHGVLHLLGYDDHTDAGYQAMIAHQEAVLAEVGVTR